MNALKAREITNAARDDVYGKILAECMRGHDDTSIYLHQRYDESDCKFELKVQRVVSNLLAKGYLVEKKYMYNLCNNGKQIIELHVSW